MKLATKVKCDDCKKNFILINSNVKMAEVEIRNKKYVLTYFITPCCGKIYRCHIADERFIELRNQISALKLSLRGKLTEEEFEKTSEKVLKLQDKMKFHSSKLNRKFNGTFAEKEDKIIYVP